MGAGSEFVLIDNYTTFHQVIRKVEELVDSDPARVFAQAAPGFLGRLCEDIGAWQGKDEMAFEFVGKGGKGVAVGSDEPAPRGSFNKKQIVGLPGFEVAGFTHVIRKQDFLYGLKQEDAARRAERPRLEFNRLIAENILDTVLQGGKSTGTPVEGFVWGATDVKGNAITQRKVSEVANQVVPTVVANATQTMLWPLRDGTETAVNHDHVIAAGGAAWTLALARTARDLILEHPGNANVVAIVGATVAETIRTVMKSELGAISERQTFIKLAIVNGGGYCDAYPVAENLEGVDYLYSPDMPATTAIYFASNKKPFYLSMGQTAPGGQKMGTGAWAKSVEEEFAPGANYGYREYATMGCKDPTAVVIVKYV